MASKVNIPPFFQRDLKYLARKYPSVSEQVRQLIRQLEQNERPGDHIPNVSAEVYKVRLPNPSAQRGKSGGFRVIYYVHVQEEVFLVSIYSKTEQSDLPPAAILAILAEILPPDDSTEAD